MVSNGPRSAPAVPLMINERKAGTRTRRAGYVHGGEVVGGDQGTCTVLEHVDLLGIGQGENQDPSATHRRVRRQPGRADLPHGTRRRGRLHAYTEVWQEARKQVFYPAQVASPPARRPYDLRHAAVSLWLNAGVSASDVAERAGHSVDMLLCAYASASPDSRKSPIGRPMMPWWRDAQAVQAGSRKLSGTLRRSCGLIGETLTSPSSADATRRRHAIRFWPPHSDRARCGRGTARPVDLRPGVARRERLRGGLAEPLPRGHEALLDHSRDIPPGARRRTGLAFDESRRTVPTHRLWRSARNVDLPVAISPPGLWRRVRGCACAVHALMIGSAGIAELQAAYAALSFRVSMQPIMPRRRGQQKGPLRAQYVLECGLR